jgi:putative CocE/NonD family hydrolase
MANEKNSEQAWTRGIFGSFLDRALGWKFGLPSETCNYKGEPMRIPVSSGLSRFELAATLYVPLLAKGTAPEGTILVRSPYGRGLPISAGYARLFASRGYQVLFVSCRGTFGSGGEFEPFQNEVEDGKAVVEWMRQQPWYTGTFATVGPSYLGFTQWALLTDPPEDMVAAVISVGPHDFGRTIWETGTLNLDMVGWADHVAHQEEPYYFVKKILNPNAFRPVLDSIPLVQGVNAAFPKRMPWLETIMTKGDLKDPHYASMNLDMAVERANIPILLITGWQDIFLGQSMEQYFRLHQRGCNVALTVGPWDHQGGIAPIITQNMHAWVDTYLSKKEEAGRKKPVEYFVSGAEEWRASTDFPPPTSAYTLHLHAGQKLRCDEPGPESSSSDFIFDPKDPTPAIGGAQLIGKSGFVDDTAMYTRSDILSFTTDTLDKDIEFIGQPNICLAHSTDNLYADLFIRISEVDAKGKSRSITETYQRLDPERDMEEEVKLSLRWCAHRFVKGKKIRVLIAGGSHPHFARNLGVANLDNRGSDTKAVKHTVFHGGVKTSRLIFPVGK